MQIEHQDGFAIIGLSAKLRNDDPAAIGALWDAFWARNIRAELGAGASDDVYCVYHEYEGGFMDPYRMTIGHRVPADTRPPEGLQSADIPPQDYAILTANGPQPQTLIAQWQAIWTGEHNRAFIADYDVYDARNPDHVTIYLGLAAS